MPVKNTSYIPQVVITIGILLGLWPHEIPMQIMICVIQFVTLMGKVSHNNQQHTIREPFSRLKWNKFLRFDDSSIWAMMRSVCYTGLLVKHSVVVLDKQFYEFTFILHSSKGGQGVRVRRTKQGWCEYNRQVLIVHHVLMHMLGHSATKTEEMRSHSYIGGLH